MACGFSSVPPAVEAVLPAPGQERVGTAAGTAAPCCGVSFLQSPAEAGSASSHRLLPH